MIIKSTVIPKFEDIGKNKRLGLVLLSSDLTTEPDYSQLIPSSVASIYSTRLKMENPITVENLRRMEKRITNAVSLLPEDVAPLSICYSCTAASIIMGEDVISKAIRNVWPNVPVVTPSSGVIKALKKYGIENISILTPYIEETSLPFIDYFKRFGINVIRLEYLAIEDDRKMARVKPDSIYQAACNLDNSESDAIFISCTALPSLGVINSLEEKLDKLILTSNQVTCWEMLKNAKIDLKLEGYGRLFKNQ